MTVAVLPMKPPDMGKTRLSGQFDAGFRKALAAAMYADVLTALSRCERVERVVVVTADFECARAAMLHDAFPLDDPGLDGHSEAALFGARHAAEEGAGRVLMVPGDCPALDPAEVDGLLARDLPDRACIVIPDRHGEGTNALLLSPPDAIEPGFGPGSRERHSDRGEQAGAHTESVELPSLAHDVDTPDDLDALIAHLHSTRGNAAHTRGLLLQLDKDTAGD